MARQGPGGRGPAIWTEVSPTAIHSLGRCGAVGSGARRGVVGGPLNRRLRDDRWTWFRRVRVEPEETQGGVRESGLAPGRREGRAAAVITFLGMELDSVKLQIRLPGEKLGDMRATLRSWRGMKSCRKRDLLSIIGVLSHASKAIRSGRSFIRRLIDLSTTVKRLDRRVRLNQTARADIEWWWQFSRRWNGVAMMVAVNQRAPECDVVSDASGSWGCGAVFRGQWFQLEWKGLGSTQGYGIMAKELFPIVVAAAVWGPEWAGKTVRARCDNLAVVAMVNSGSCREAEDSVMLWAAVCLCFFRCTRVGEITAPQRGNFDPGAHLTFQDIVVDNADKPQKISVSIKASKTDPFRVGVDIHVGWTGKKLCPVAAIVAYLVARKDGPGPLFRFEDGRPLTRPRLVLEVRRALDEAGASRAGISGHSFRNGAATMAAEQGVEDSTIKDLGRWRSNAYQRYIRRDRANLDGLAEKLAREEPNAGQGGPSSGTS